MTETMPPEKQRLLKREEAQRVLLLVGDIATELQLPLSVEVGDLKWFIGTDGQIVDHPPAALQDLTFDSSDDVQNKIIRIAAIAHQSFKINNQWFDRNGELASEENAARFEKQHAMRKINS